MSSATPPPSSLSRVRERAGVRAAAHAKVLRSQSTDAEQHLWHRLRSRRLGGYKFRRQHVIDGFIADFACLEVKLVVELDGGQHFEPQAQIRDGLRTAHLATLGFTVLRFDNLQALTRTDAVLSTILDRLRAAGPHPNPLPPAGEGAEHSGNPT